MSIFDDKNFEQTKAQSNNKFTQPEEKTQQYNNSTADLKQPEVKSLGNISYSNEIKNKLKEKNTVLIKINQHTSYSGRTKDSILDERKRYVSQTFNLPNYNPKESIFGGIVDNKPWIGIKGAYCDGWESVKGRTDGASEESIFMNNPLGLVMIEMPYYGYIQKNSCSTEAKLLPTKIIASKDSIDIYYNLSYFHSNFVQPEGRKYTIYYLKPINAKDFGFEWGFVANKKNIGFSSNNAISKSVYYFLDFIHCGGACKVEGGCNNGSPNQRELEFMPHNFPAYMQIYLWKTQPEHTYTNPDMIVNLYLN